MDRTVSESSPLLPEQIDDEGRRPRLDEDSENVTDAETCLKLGDELNTTRVFEAKSLAISSGPLMLAYVLQYSFNLTAIMVGGHLGTAELGAVSLAGMLANVTGLAVYEGLATSLDTLCSQAYGGNNKKMVGLHLQRMVYFLWLVTVPVAAIWLCSPWILEALVPEKDVARLASSYLRFYLIGAPGYATFEAGKRFVQAQGYFNPSLYVLLVGAPLNILMNWLFVFKFHWGLAGAGAAVSVTNTALPILLLLYIRFVIPSSLECWPGFSKDAFHNWIPMVRLSLPGIIMVQGEWLAFDLLTFASAYLGTVELAAQSVLFNVAVFMYHIPLPASIAVSTRLGNMVGAGALKAARVAVTVYYFIFIGIGIFDLSFILALKDVIPKLFSNDDAVRQVLSRMMPLLACIQFVDSTTALCNGIIRGFGRQYIGGWVNILVYYAFAFPTSLFLTFGPPHLGLWGLWIGPTFGIAGVTVLVSFFIKRMSWQKCVDEARGRSS